MLARGLLIGLAVVLLGLLVVYWQIRSVASDVVVRDVRPPAALSVSNGTNILIIGTDERVGFPGEGVRGDTLIVAHLDTFGRWANLLSIPRDTLVTLPDVGDTKINVAYGQGYARAEELYGPGAAPQQGGMALAAQTVEELLRLNERGQRINYVAQINFNGFARIIDALGGITIDVPYHIVDEEYPTEDFGYQRIEFQQGVQRMNGEQALIYARTRHGSSDFERGARQQQVMRAIVSELRGRGPIGVALAVPKLREGIQGAVTTTMPFDRPDVLVGLLWLASGINPDEVGQIRLSDADPNFQQDAYYNIIWSEEGLRAATDLLVAAPSQVAEEARVQVLNGTDVSGLASKVAGRLEDEGFIIIPSGNAPTTDAPRTIVYNLNNKPRTSSQLAKLLGAEVRQGAPPGVETQADIVVVLGQDAVPEQ
jgi:LCP family protein required for cell wall assembly